MVMNVLQTCCLLLSFVVLASAFDEDRKVYIVYMGFLPEGEYSPSVHHYEILKNITSPRLARKALIRSYVKSFNGFVANLTEEEKQKLAGNEGIVSVFPSQKVHLHTTRSWDFMGFPTTIKRSPMIERDIIIGVIDSGIWPESESFNDEGLGPIPPKWKGVCLGGKNFACNSKIIGARSYGAEDTARDYNGHGTHVSAILAGKQVPKASYYGLAQGTARGGVPGARLAIYKVCGEKSCDMGDVLAAFDDAIHDGVDIISISMGDTLGLDITADPIAIGAFHAMLGGILTVQAAGNDGQSYTVKGDAPWILSVGASNTNRHIINKVRLGDGTILEGTSINSHPSSPEELPLVYGKQITRMCPEIQARYCIPRCLDSSLIREKVVLCDGNMNADFVTAAGARGCIIPNDGFNVSDIGPLPAAALNRKDMNLVRTYQKSAKIPKVQILKSQDINNPAAPLVAPFSSRGPSKYISDIIKPDVTAPGVEILAAYSPIGSPSRTFINESSVKYSILSGTSMACPHVAAAAAFVMSFHPDWSPSAIKSALMTTARRMDPSQSLGAEFAYGSGHIDPQKAKDPGLVFDISNKDYLNIWFNISRAVNTSCLANLTVRQLNYPSMVARVDVKSAFELSFTRTVTNVGNANSKYAASIQGDPKFYIRVEPKHLQFTALNQKRSFVVTVAGNGIKSPQTTQGMSLLWSDGNHNVNTPIVVYTGNATTSSGGVSTQPRICRDLVILLAVSIVITHCIGII